MADTTPPPANPPPAPAWDPEVIFPVLADPVRRRLLLSLARGAVSPASVLKGGVGRRLDATLKHLIAMRAAGLVVTRPDPADGRRMLYSLAPAVPVVKTDKGAVMDFGCCVVRLT